MAARCLEGSWGVRAGLSRFLWRLMRLLKTSRGHTPLMGLKPLKDPPTKWRGKVERIKPAGGEATGSATSTFCSFGLGWKGCMVADRGERSGVRGMLTGSITGWKGCRERERERSCDRKGQRSVLQVCAALPCEGCCSLGFQLQLRRRPAAGTAVWLQPSAWSCCACLAAGPGLASPSPCCPWVAPAGRKEQSPVSFLKCVWSLFKNKLLLFSACAYFKEYSK